MGCVSAGGCALRASPTTTTVSTSKNPSTFGQPVAITVQVSPPTATGKATIFDGTTIVGIATLSGGQATVTTILLPTGANSLTAYYAGDSSNAASASAPLQQTVNAVGAKAYRISASYPVGQAPRALAIGDFNGDAKADIAVVNENDNTVSVLLGTGTGGFSPAGTYNVSADPWFISIGDFNGDGKTDLIIVATRDVNPQVATVGQLNVLLGNGDGTFQPPVNTDSRYLPTQVAIADFNSDGIADLAVIVNGSNEVDVHLGNGDGTFQPFTSYSLTRASGGVAADFNGDGRADLAVAAPGDVNIFLGKGDGTIQLLPAQYNLGQNYPGFLAAGDFNGDGKTDLVVTGGVTASTLDVYLGNGDGTFQTGASYTAGPAAFALAVADLNGDGILDLVTSNYQGDNLGIYYGKGDGTFQPAISFGAGSSFFGPTFVAVGDFNGDGIPDFAVANNGYNEITIVLGVASLAPDLTVSKSHSGTFSQTQKGATYTITVSNVGLQSASGTVSVVDNLPSSLTATAIGGTGWSCSLSSLTCTRSDVLGVNAAYPPVTVTVNVAPNAPSSITNTATVSGGGETNTGNDTASDVTAIRQANAPVLSSSGIVNATFASGALPASPGSLIAIFGSNLSASAQGATVDSSGRLPTSLGGTSLQIESKSAPLLYVSPGQVNAQVPFELTPGTYSVVLTTAAGGASSPVNLTVSATSPGVFAGAVANNATGALITAANPFRPGDVIVVYCTGLGAVSPGATTGQLAPSSPISSTIATPTVTIGGVPVQIANSVLSVGFVALYQIGIVIPGGLPQGTQPLVISSGGVTTSTQVFSGPSTNPQYCADVSGTWNVTQSGNVTEIVTSAVENDNFTDPFSSQGTINIVQTGCSITYAPSPIPGLITQAQASALARTGTVTGTTVTLQGLLTTPALAVAAVPGLTITQVSQNQFQASGQLAGAILTTTDTGNFTGNGTYSENGQSGSFTLKYVLTGSTQLVRPGVTAP